MSNLPLFFPNQPSQQPNQVIQRIDTSTTTTTTTTTATTTTTTRDKFPQVIIQKAKNPDIKSSISSQGKLSSLTFEIKINFFALQIYCGFRLSSSLNLPSSTGDVCRHNNVFYIVDA